MNHEANRATPRPWRVGEGSPDIPSQATIRTDGWDVVHCFGEQSEANASLIVRAVNAYDAHRALVEAAKESLELLRATIDQGALKNVKHLPDTGDGLRNAVHDSIEQLRVALRAVEAAEKGESK